jgi:hypothetical protein
MSVAQAWPALVAKITGEFRLANLPWGLSEYPPVLELRG